MTYSAQIIGWGVAACAPLLINLALKKTDAVGLSVMLLMGWCFGRITGALYAPPDSMTLYPIVDAACGITAFAAWSTKKAPWKLALVGLFIVQCCGHLAFWVTYPTDNASLWRYIALNNLWFALQLLCVAGGGVWDVARGASADMFDRTRGRSHARARP